MHDLDKLIDRGITERYKLPLGKVGLCLEYTIIRHREPTKVAQRKEYLANLKISYKDKELLDGIVAFELFLANLRVFIDRKGHFDEKGTFFTEKKKGDNSSLRLMIDENEYINMIDAIQVNSLIYGAFQGVSKKLLYLKYKIFTKNYISSKVDDNQNNIELKNTVVIDFDKEVAS